MNEFGMKELYDVTLKATYPIEVSGRTIEVGETVAAFDKIQWADFSELKAISAARGGYGNPGLVWWEETKEVRVRFVQGVFSKTQLGLMTGAKLTTVGEKEVISIQTREVLETDESGVLTPKYFAQEPIFFYNKNTGDRINSWTRMDNTFSLGVPFLEVVVDYTYSYDNGASLLSIGQQFTKGFLSLQAKTKVKDETTGQVKTGILRIPKLKLMSDLSLRLGEEATPLVGTLDAVAIPVGNRGQKRAMELLFLSDDIDSDM